MYCRRLYKEADKSHSDQSLAIKTQSAPTLNNQEVHKFTARHSPRRSPKKHKFSESNNSKCYFCGGPQAHKDRSKCPAVNKRVPQL